jgi:hypothetical protein
LCASQRKNRNLATFIGSFDYGLDVIFDIFDLSFERLMPVTAAATFRAIETLQPTLLIDEADTFFGENVELRGILNSGHRTGGASHPHRW